MDSGVFNVFNNLTGGPGRNRTTDTRIFNPHVLVFAIVELCASVTSGHAFNEAKFTPKGIKWVAGLMASERASSALKELEK